jgi:hypothetical protein
MLSNKLLATPQNRALLAVVPGLFAALGLADSERSTWIPLVSMLILLVVAVASKQFRWPLPDWSLLAVGIMFGLTLPFVLSTTGLIVALVTNTSPSPTSSLFVLVLPWIGIAVLLCLMPPSSSAWSMLAGIVLACILVRVKYLVLFGVSWPIIWRMLGVSLWSAGTLLLPIVFVGLLRRQYGEAAVLFAVGATFVWYQVLIDNAYKVSENVAGVGLFWLYLVASRLPFVVVGPWLFLRAQGSHRKLLGLTLPVCLSVVVNIVTSGIVRGDFTTIIWLSSIPYTISIILSLVLAYWLCRSINENPNHFPVRQPAS